MLTHILHSCLFLYEKKKKIDPSIDANRKRSNMYLINPAEMLSQKKVDNFNSTFLASFLVPMLKTKADMWLFWHYFHTNWSVLWPYFLIKDIKPIFLNIWLSQQNVKKLSWAKNLNSEAITWPKINFANLSL